MTGSSFPSLENEFLISHHTQHGNQTEVYASESKLDSGKDKHVFGEVLSERSSGG